MHDTASPPTCARVGSACFRRAHTPGSSILVWPPRSITREHQSTSCSAAITSPAPRWRNASRAAIDDLDRLLAPRIVAPAHCTGWRAKAGLADRFAPGRYAPSVVGTRYLLIAA